MRAAFLAATLAAVLWAAPAANASFGVTAFSAAVTDASNHAVTQAGAHPYVGVTDFTLSGSENVRDIRVDLPPGLISTPQAADTCTDAQFPSSCPASSQVGV